MREGRMYKICAAIGLLVLTAFSVSHFKVRATQDGGKVNVSCSPAKPSFTLHEPVKLNLMFQNDLTQPIQVDLGEDRKGSFLFIVTQPNGNKVQLTQYRSIDISLP